MPAHASRHRKHEPSRSGVELVYTHAVDMHNTTCTLGMNIVTTHALLYAILYVCVSTLVDATACVPAFCCACCVLLLLRASVGHCCCVLCVVVLLLLPVCLTIHVAP